MKKKDILELKRRMTKNNCTITRICGCVVDTGKNIVTMFEKPFLNLDDEEYFKYLDIAKGVMKGKLKDNLLNLKLEEDQKENGGMQQCLLALRDSGLNSSRVQQGFYDHIIENYDYPGEYLILLFHDAYDVMMKTSDNNKLDESEEVYEYLICAICPINLAAPGLAYSEEEKDITNRIRDKIVDAPTVGFIYPAFTDRSEDRDTMLVYEKDAKTTHKDLVASLGCVPEETATEQRETLKEIITNAIGDVDESDIKVYEDFHRILDEKLEEEAKKELERAEQQKLTIGILAKTLETAGADKTEIEAIEKEYRNRFDKTPDIAAVVDEKAVKASVARDPVEMMKKMLADAAKEIEILAGGETELSLKIREMSKPDNSGSPNP